MTTAPNLEAFQDFSKQQIEAFTAASTTLTKGLQEIAAELTDYSKKAFAAGSAVLEKLLGARSVEAAVQISDRIRQAGLRGLCRPVQQVLGALQRESPPTRSSRSPRPTPASRIIRAIVAAERGENKSHEPTSAPFKRRLFIFILCERFPVIAAFSRKARKIRARRRLKSGASASCRSTRQGSARDGQIGNAAISGRHLASAARSRHRSGLSQFRARVRMCV